MVNQRSGPSETLLIVCIFWLFSFLKRKTRGLFKNVPLWLLCYQTPRCPARWGVCLRGVLLAGGVWLRVVLHAKVSVSAVSCTPRSLTTRCKNLPTFLEFNQEHKKHEKVSVKIFDNKERCHDLIHEIIKH